MRVSYLQWVNLHSYLALGQHSKSTAASLSLVSELHEFARALYPRGESDSWRWWTKNEMLPLRDHRHLLVDTPWRTR